MGYKAISEKFIQRYPDYKSDINNFSEYLNVYWKDSLSNDLFRILVRGMDIEFVLQVWFIMLKKLKDIKLNQRLGVIQ